MTASTWFKATGTAVALLGLAIGIDLYGRAAVTALSPAKVSTRTVPLREFEQLERFGSVEVTTSDAPPRGLVMLATAASEAQASREDAVALAGEGLIAVTIDLDAFRRALESTPPDEDCHYVSDDLKDIAQAVHRALGIERYFFPVLAGRGEGAAFAYAALAQAPDNTVAGAVSIGFEPVLRSDRSYCFEPLLEPAREGTFKLRAEPALPSPWHVIVTNKERTSIEQFQHDIPKADVIPVDADTRRALVESAIRLSRAGERGTSGLPVSIVRPNGSVTGLALIVSGDGGWRDIDKTIGDLLAKRGVAVVGLDSFRYFWSKKDPAQVAADLALLLEYYGKEFGTDRHALIGFSFGADIMPDVWPLLPKAVRGRVRTVSLLGLGLTADFEITVAGFVGATTAESRPLAPLLNQLPLEKTQCIYGKEDAEAGETSCTAPEFDRGERVAMEGGHHFDGDYGAVAEAIAERIQQGSLEEANATEATHVR